MSSVVKEFEMRYEGVARAIRRGDIGLLRQFLDEISTVWREAPKWSDESTKSLALGMKMAIEGVIGFALARVRGDAAHSLLGGRKHAKAVLHALAKKARARNRQSKEEKSRDDSEGSLILTELAATVGAQSQNLGKLIDEMEEVGLLTSSRYGVSRRVRVSSDGLHLLESVQPGWQQKDVAMERDDVEPIVDDFTRWLQGSSKMRSLVSHDKSSVLVYSLPFRSRDIASSLGEEDPISRGGRLANPFYRDHESTMAAWSALLSR